MEAITRHVLRSNFKDAKISPMTDDENCIHGYSAHSIVAFQRRLSTRNSLVVSTAVATVTFLQNPTNGAITRKGACFLEPKMPHIRCTG